MLTAFLNTNLECTASSACQKLKKAAEFIRPPQPLPCLKKYKKEKLKSNRRTSRLTPSALQVPEDKTSTKLKQRSESPTYLPASLSPPNPNEAKLKIARKL